VAADDGGRRHPGHRRADRVGRLKEVVAVPLLHAVVYGIVQGVTEFLPVSSSGHLALLPWLFDWDHFGDDQALENAFDVALHVGTLLGAAWYLRADIARYTTAVLRWGGRGPLTGDARIAGLLALTAVPTGLMGGAVLAFTDDLGDRTWLVATALIVFGALLWWADRRPVDQRIGDLGVRHAVALGVAQGLAFQPGVSRSGATLTVARGIGLERTEAARLVFLMSLPVIAGAGIVKAFDVEVPAGWWPPFLVGVAAAAVSGWLAVHWLLRLVAHRRFDGFVVYRVLLGAAVLGLLATGVR